MSGVGPEEALRKMFSWGEDCQRGFCLKDGSNTDSKTEDGVHYLNLSYHIRDLSAGHNVLAFVKTNGDAFIIRTNESKDGRRVGGKQKLVKCKEKIQAVSCGDNVVTLLSERGTVRCVDISHTSTPRPLEALSYIPVCQVACGSQHSVALTKDGQVYTWGLDSRGQLGLGKRRPGVSSPQHLQSLSATPLVQISAGGEQSFALSVSGGVFSWGRNDCGQLGLGDTTDRHTPTPVPCLNMKKTIHISCGRDHTAILTKDGAVFTFGSGQYGQLGHNSFTDELCPRLVAEFFGAKVTKIACGQHHTLVLTDSKRVYSFGCGEQGQLGHGDESHPSVPLPVQLPQDGDGPRIRNIFAGGNCSFATCTAIENAQEDSNTNSVSKVAQHCLDDMIDKWTSNCDSKSWKKIKQEIHRTFSSASCVNKSFLDQSKDKHFQTSPKYPGLNLPLARLAFKKLIKRDDVLAEVEAAVLHLLQSLYKKPVGVEGLRIFLILSELLHVIQKHNQQKSTKLAEAVAAAVLSLSAESLQVIGDWWSSLSSSTMVEHVKVWKKALSVILSFTPIPRNSAVNLLLVLQHMYNANDRIGRRQRIPEKTYCLGISREILIEDLLSWRSESIDKDMNHQPLFIHNFPFVMDLKSKKMAFDISAEYTQREHQNPGLSGCVEHLIFYFELKLKRASLLEGTFKQLAVAHHTAFKKPLVVYFDEDPKITDVYKRDLFHHLFHDMMSTKSLMFMFSDSKTLAWFPSQATEEDKTNFFLFGVLCGLALYNKCIIHLPFPLALFKKLLGLKPTLDDLMELSPCVGKSLQYALDYEDDLLDLYMYFTIDWDGTEVDLDPENPGKPVTSQNKKEFVDAYVNHVFNTSVESVFQEFKRGFFLVCDGISVKLFRPEELQGVLVGKDVYDWAKLKQNTVYEQQYHIGHPTIKMFWEVFDELTEEQKKDFLWFLTGFRKVPILGMDQIQMKVRDKMIQSSSYDQHFPESLTCHSILELPIYSTKDIMRNRLIEALIPDRGF
ncbi:LOW QUALITY PROTEIN: probable E3 ubiquitin-protein ligase HERC4 [Lates calcarifer]|uniref:LOW QUALITY PROTEIN: probable E3 ubiquitin-protein ligase HERC4 n=1 Tax=Lates calcarifer TaxID=8187 RepID=A0AAJ7QLW6_LATCA|nr:LOW QUALITY PROTEIN: probable E3 ubiquitin-protein ligase HERC4 [Lates calcarifer]